METVNGLILVLVLLADQGSLELGQAVQEALETGHGAHIELVLDPAAEERLQDYGVGSADLLADRHIGRQLTRFQAVVIIQLEQRRSGQDTVQTARLWFDGESDSFVAIAGPEADPTPDLVNGVLRLLRGHLGSADSTVGDNRSGTAEGVPLTALVERQAWQPLLGALATREQKTPRDWYYTVLAYVRLHQRDAAVAALNDFRAAYEEHFLVAAAAAIIPPPEATSAEIEAAVPSDGLPSAPDDPEPSTRGQYELTEEIDTSVDRALQERLGQSPDADPTGEDASDTADSAEDQPE